MKTEKFLILILFLSIFTVSNAQKLNTSPMTRYGVGELYFQGNIRQLAMGKTGIGDFSSYNLTNLNPAAVSALKPNNVIFEVGAMQRISLFNNGTQQQWDNFSDIKYIYTGFRLFKWWHTSIGITPYSGAGYNVSSSDTITEGDYTNNFDIDYDGSGSINQLFWTNSFTLFKKISIAAKLNYTFGSFDRQSSITYSYTDTITSSTYDTSAYSFTSATIIKDRNIFKNITYDFGFNYHDTIEIKSKPVRFSIGAIFSNKQTINSYMTKILLRSVMLNNRSYSDSLFYDTVSSSYFNLPQTIGFGFNLSFPKFTIAGDYVTQQWSKTKIFGTKNFLNSQFIGLGMEYCKDPASTRYLRTIRYRLGAYDYSSYISFNDKQLKSQAITFGFGFPFQSAILNLGFVVGQTGSIDLGLKETFYEINLGVSLYDLWFVKRKFL